MMNCGKVQNLLSCYIDRELPGVDMLAIQRHLDSCADCWREYQTLLQVKRLLSEMPVVSPPLTLEERLVEKVLHTPAPVGGWRWTLPGRLLRPVAVAAAVAAIAVGAWYLGVQPRSPGEEEGFVAASGLASEIDRATLDAYLSGKLHLRRQPFIPAEIPLYPYDNRTSLVSVRYYR
ncbi:MAG: anti-sigma factor [Armatimonadota bacterium]|nr:anti-sigma factor [bacterium]MDW8322287.1 anti-sigma factor [Armatimonadota bacterium]